MLPRKQVPAVIFVLAFVVTSVTAACGGGGNSLGDIIATTTAEATQPATIATSVPAAATAVAEPTATPNSNEYVVQAGDTLGGIAQQFNTTVDALVELNQIADPNMILPGDTLQIPQQ